MNSFDKKILFINTVVTGLAALVVQAYLILAFFSGLNKEPLSLSSLSQLFSFEFIKLNPTVIILFPICFFNTFLFLKINPKRYLSSFFLGGFISFSGVIYSFAFLSLFSYNFFSFKGDFISVAGIWKTAFLYSFSGGAIAGLLITFFRVRRKKKYEQS